MLNTSVQQEFLNASLICGCSANQINGFNCHLQMYFNVNRMVKSFVFLPIVALIEWAEAIDK
jgi:hypothetical protein